MLHRLCQSFASTVDVVLLGSFWYTLCLIYSQLGLSSEISGSKFPEIFSKFPGNLLITYVNQLFPSPASVSYTHLTLPTNREV